MVVGLTVSKCLHAELLEHGGEVLLVKRAEADIREDTRIADNNLEWFSKNRRPVFPKVVLKWQGQPVACFVQGQ